MGGFRVLTWNLWHALNPYHRLMLPAESSAAREQRRQRQCQVLAGLARSQAGSPDSLPAKFDDTILCLQELNPLRAELSRFRTTLGLQGNGCLVNSGLKLMGLGLPPFLEEGLAILAGKSFSDPSWQEATLSGQPRQFHGPFGISASFQLSEVRKALLFEAQWQGKRIAVVNLHLHNGSDRVAVDADRKLAELQRLRSWLEPKLSDWDWVVICGDFNSDPGSPCLEPIHAMGFKDAAVLAGGNVEPTWDPKANPLAGLSPEMASSPESREWDSAPHVFDHVYLFTGPALAQKPLRVRLSQIREPELSDHFGVMTEISWG